MSVPDVKIFPHATGEAAKTVADHTAKQNITFFAACFCPFVQRVSPNPIASCLLPVLADARVQVWSAWEYLQIPYQVSFIRESLPKCCI